MTTTATDRIKLRILEARIIIAAIEGQIEMLEHNGDPEDPCIQENMLNGLAGLKAAWILMSGLEPDDLENFVAEERQCLYRNDQITGPLRKAVAEQIKRDHASGVIHGDSTKPLTKITMR